MRLLFYCNQENENGQCKITAKVLKDGLPGWRVMVHEDLDLFFKTLRSPLGSPAPIIILCLQSQDETDIVLHHRDLLKGLELILILPEEPGKVGAKTWLLEPRISFYGLPTGYSLCAILQKMAQRMASRPQLGSVDGWHAPIFDGGSGLINEEW